MQTMAILIVAVAIAALTAVLYFLASAGLDRPLRYATDYRRFAGRLAKIVVSVPLECQPMVLAASVVALPKSEALAIWAIRPQTAKGKASKKTSHLKIA